MHKISCTSFSLALAMLELRGWRWKAARGANAPKFPGRTPWNWSRQRIRNTDDMELCTIHKITKGQTTKTDANHDWEQSKMIRSTNTMHVCAKFQTAEKRAKFNMGTSYGDPRWPMHVLQNLEFPPSKSRDNGKLAQVVTNQKKNTVDEWIKKIVHFPTWTCM